MTDQQPLEHIVRAELPWRTGPARTECGRSVDDVKAWITFDEAKAKFARLGKQRAALFTCMTCADRAGDHPSWEMNPGAVVNRATDGARYAPMVRRDNPDDPRVAEVKRSDAEWRAIAALVEAHREEYETFVEGHLGATDLAERRRSRSR